MALSPILTTAAISAGNSIIVLAVFAWAWMRSYRLNGALATYGIRLRAILVTFAVVIVLLPLISRSVLLPLKPNSPDQIWVWQSVSAVLGLVYSAAYAFCWYLLLSLVFDLAHGREASPANQAN